MAAALPFVILFIPVVWGVLWLVARRDGVRGADGQAVLGRELVLLGPPSRAERKVAAVFASAALLWVFADPIRQVVAPAIAQSSGFKMENRHYEMTVALLAAAALLALRVVSWRSLRRIPYSTLILLGGSFSMAHGMEQSGLAKWIGGQLVGVAALSLPAQVLLASTATVFLSAVASNVATINVVLNVLPGSTPVLFSAAVAASCDFMLPAGTPPNAIVFGSGYVRLSTMMRVGFVLDVAAALLVTGYVLLYARFWF